MLKKINANGVVSESFSIQISHPDILKYKCRDEIFEVDVGYDPIKRIIHVYASDSAKFYKMTEEKKIKWLTTSRKLLSF